MPTLHAIPLRLPAGFAAVLVTLALAPDAPAAVAARAGAAPTAMVRAQPADSPASRLTVAAVKAKLAAATQSSPPDLSKSDLSGLDLTGVDFKRANLAGALLAGTKLAGANLFSCDLADASLAGADATKANLDGTVLRRANLEKANLQGASMFATIIEADRKSTRLNSSHVESSYAVFCLRKKR